MRVALKLAYIGSAYYGSQVQSDVATVEGEVFRAFQQIGIMDDPRSANFQSSGRTDAGVHATGQVVAFDTDKTNLSIPRVINNELPNSIWAWSHALVPDDFDPRRHATSRAYRYILHAEQHDISLIRSASKLLLGTHDFANFCTPNSDKITVRTVNRIDVRVNGNLIKIDIEAKTFLWKMVRKVATALVMVGSSVRDLDWFKQMLDPEAYEEGLKPAPAYGLTLMDVQYQQPPEWIDDGYAIRRANGHVQENLVYHRVMGEVMGEFMMKDQYSTSD